MADDQTIEELTRAVQALQQTIAQGKTVDPKEVEKVNRAMQNVARGSKAQADAEKIQTQRTLDNTKGTTRFASVLGGTTSNLGGFATRLAGAAIDIQNNQEQFSSLNGSIDLAAGLFKTTAKATAGLGDATGTALSAIPLIGPVVGGLVSGVSKATAALAEATADIASQIGKQVTAQLDSASAALQMAGQSGAIGAEGITGLSNQAIQAGLSFKDFASITKSAGGDLAFAFGDATKGAKMLANTSDAMRPFRTELEALGIGAKQQNEMTAAYIKNQARQGNIEGRSARELAQGSAEYAKRLTTLSRLTGKSVDEQQKELDKQMSNARMVGAIAEVQAKFGEKAASSMKDTAAGISGILGDDFGKGLQDALAGNLGTESAQGFARAAGQMGQQAVDLLRKGEISSAEAQAMILKGTKKVADDLGGPAGLGRIAGLGTAFEPMILGMQKASMLQGKSAGEIEKLSTATTKQANTQDEATQGLIKGKEAMRLMAEETNKIAVTALPAMGAAATTVAKTMTDAMKEINKMVSMGADAYARDLTGVGAKDTVETGDVAATTGGGALAGAAAGAALGLIGGPLAPITSTLGAIAGALIGGAGGFFAGKEGVGQDMFDFDDDSWLGSLFNKNPNIPKKAVGGPVQSGKSYVVGETGPELLMSGMNGNIVPNAGPAGGYSGMDLGSAGALTGMGMPMDGIAQALSGNADNTLAEAQISRLDELVSTMTRSLSIQQDLLQAAHR